MERKMADITVSVIIPIYNMEKYLKKCLDSVINQTLNNIEIICIDDGSTDCTMEILESYKSFRRITVMTQENRGAAVSRNRGIEAAKGEFVAFMDPDDYYADKEALKCLYTCAKRENVAVCGGRILCEYEGTVSEQKKICENFEQNGRVRYRDYQHIYGYTGFIFCKNFLKNHFISFPDYRRFQDIPFIVKALIHADIFYVVPHPVYIYRIVDKVISYDDAEIINGIARGIDDVLIMSGKAHYEILHTDIVLKLLNSYIDWFYKSVYEGNKVLLDLIRKIWSDIDEELLLQDGRVSLKPMFKEPGEIDSYVENVNKKKEKLWKRIICFPYIIIYGAGLAGKKLFEYIMKNHYEGVVEFGVSASDSSGTACGKSIRPMNAYLEHKEDALILIAVKGDSYMDMADMAEKMGFKNLDVVFYSDIIYF